MSDSERKKSKHGGRSRSYKSSLFVRNLNTSMKPDDVKKIFNKYAEVKDVYLPLDYKTREPRGFGFIEFFNQEDAKKALEETNGLEVEGEKLSVMIAKEGRKTPSEMRHRDRRRSHSRDRRRRHRRSPSSSRSSRSNSRSKKKEHRKKKHRRSSSRSSSGSRRSRSSSENAGKKSSKAHNKKKSEDRSKNRSDSDSRSRSDSRSKS